MKLMTWSSGLPLVGLAGISVVIAVAACSSTKNNNPNPQPTGGSCTKPAAGTFPVANCVTGDTCPANADPGCKIDTAKCGDPGTCMPMANNAGKTKLDFRIRRLNVAAPQALTQSFIQSTVVTKNIDLKAAECGENGQGAFNWLLRIDTAANTITTGGAPPTADPFGVGYCFYDHQPPPLNDGGPVPPYVAPMTVPVTKNADGSFTAQPGAKLNVPIFLNGLINDVIVLPISQATIQSVTVSNDNNCIGAFNRPALDSQCGDDPSTCEKWHTAGSLGGYITLEEADGVFVADLSETLCVLLTSSPKDPATNGCHRDPATKKITFQGDYCSTTKKAGDCADSFWMAATFAASAVKIDESGSVPECKAGGSTADGGAPDASDAGSTMEDGGNDAGASDASDAGTD